MSMGYNFFIPFIKRTGREQYSPHQWGNGITRLAVMHAEPTPLHTVSQACWLETRSHKWASDTRTPWICAGRDMAPCVLQEYKQPAAGQKRNPCSLWASSSLQLEEGKEKAVITSITAILFLVESYQNCQREDKDADKKCQKLQQP